MRTRFEELCVQKFGQWREAGNRANDNGAPLDREALCWKTPEGNYGVAALNAAWWGWRMAMQETATLPDDVAVRDPLGRVQQAIEYHEPLGGDDVAAVLAYKDRLLAYAMRDAGAAHEAVKHMQAYIDELARKPVTVRLTPEQVQQVAKSKWGPIVAAPNPLPSREALKDALRATGFLTQNQAWDAADAVLALLTGGEGGEPA
jgi:hypothetical protein